MKYANYPFMEQKFTDLLTKEKRRQRIVVGALTLGVALVVLSSRSERAMFHTDTLPGVFATLGEPDLAIPIPGLRDRSPSAFFAGLRSFKEQPTGAGNGRNVIPAASLQQIGPIAQNLMYAGNTPDIFTAPGLLPFGSTPRLPGTPPSMKPPLPLPEGGYTAPSPSAGGGGDLDRKSDDPPPSKEGTIPESENPPVTDNSPPTGTPGPEPKDPPVTDHNPPVDTPKTVSPVPEPQSWALMIIGFMAVGGMMRAFKTRQRSAGSPQAAS